MTDVRDHDTGEPNSRIYFGRVSHRRVRTAAHRFTLRVVSLYLDLDELPRIGRRLWLLSYNRWNIFSFLDRDHGPRDGTPLRGWIDRQMQDAGFRESLGSVRILCFPRLFGYVFNPLSIWFIHSAEDRLQAIMYEVSNTFGQHHCYLLPVGKSHQAGKIVEQRCRKSFYVSPFIAMGAEYRFRLHEPSRHLSIAILEADEHGTVMSATHRGTAAPLTDRNLIIAVLKYPFVTMRVIAGIHWQALRLWLKGVPLNRRPAPPGSLVSFEEPAHPQQARSTR